MNNKENSLEENNIETSESHRKLGEDCTNSKLTKRQEMMERSKTEKEKMDEMRRLRYVENLHCVIKSSH